MSLKKEQKVLLSLLKEIDSLCRKHQIEYFLSPRLTLCAAAGRPFPENPLYGVVLMKTADMERFRQAVQDDLREGRALESMKNHKWFPGFYLRYEDTNTLFLNMDSMRDYAHPGLGINILPLRARVSSDRKQKSDSFWENGWLRHCDSIGSRNPGRRVRAAEFLLRLRCLTGQADTAARLYDNFCRHQGKEETGVYVLKRRKQTITFPDGMFEKTVRLPLEDYKFSVPADTEGYLRASYGKNYLDDQDPQYVQNPQIIVSARVGCDDFLAGSDELRRFAGKRISLIRINEKTGRLKEYANRCWDYASLCAERMNLGVLYERRKGYIKNLYKNEDYLRLEDEFQMYAKMMNRSLEQGELFAEDEEIFDIYVDVLSKTGKTVQKSKIDRLI